MDKASGGTKLLLNTPTSPSVRKPSWAIDLRSMSVSAIRGRALCLCVCVGGGGLCVCACVCVCVCVLVCVCVKGGGDESPP